MKRLVKILIIILLILAALAGGYAYWHYITYGGFFKKPLVVKVTLEHQAPLVTEVHQTTGSGVEIMWHVTPDPLFSHAVIHAWSEKYNYRSVDYLSVTTAAVDANEKQSGEEYFYYVEAFYSDGTSTESSVKRLTILEAPQLPSPSSLKAEWTRINNDAYISLTWRPPVDNLSAIRGYALYAEDATLGALIPAATHTELQESMQRLIKLNNAEALELDFAVASLGHNNNQSNRVTVAVQCPVAEIPAPTAVTLVQSGKDKFTIKWNYSNSSNIVGFRLYSNGQEVKNEKQLAATQRDHNYPIPSLNSTSLHSSGSPQNSSQEGIHSFSPMDDIHYRFQVAAVSRQGVLSPMSNAANATLKVKDHPTHVSRPVYFVANWQEKDEQLYLRVSWRDSWPKGTASAYRLEIAALDSNNFTLLQEVNTAQEQLPDELWFSLADIKASVLKLTATGLDGISSVSITTEIPDPASLMPMARLLNYRLLPNGGQEKLEWYWRYPDLAMLKGFRIYQNGMLIADEATLSKHARKWLSPPMDLNDSIKFEIEAVGYGDFVSARGPEQYFVALP